MIVIYQALVDAARQNDATKRLQRVLAHTDEEHKERSAQTAHQQTLQVTTHT